MKKFFLPAVFFSFLLTSCSTDDTLTQDVAPSYKREAAAGTSSTIYKDGQTADYRENPYDYAGKLYSQIYMATLAQTPSATVQSITTATDNAALANADFTSLASNYSNNTADQVQWILDNGNNTSAIVNSATTSVAGRQRLNDFITLLTSIEGQSFPEIYGNIVAFEQTIPGNASLTSTDRQIILTTTSIARYSCHDRVPSVNWVKVRLGICGGMNGAALNMQHAITRTIAVQMAP